MAIEIKVPALGEGVESGDVLEVFVQEGETITKDQGLVELETDKATVTIPASAAGKITKLHIKAGDTVQVGQLIVSLEGAAASDETAAKPAASPAAAAKPVAEKKAEKAEVPASPAQPTVKSEAAAPKVPESKPAAARPAAPAGERGESAAAAAKDRPTLASSLSQVAAGPALRRFAREVGVDLRTVVPSGDHGRVTRDDILAVVRRGSQQRSAAPEATRDHEGPSDQYGPIRAEKLPKIRATIAQKMHESWSTVPRVTNFDDADITELEQIRQNNKKDYESRGIKLTTLPFLVKAVAMALKSHPVINAVIDLERNQVIYKDYVNIGIAVDTERGLVVPNLRNADRLAVPDIAKALGQIAENVRSGQFSVDDLRGGTFTISNLGAIGGTYSTPIVNVPELAILLAGRARKMPVVRGDDVVVRLMLPLSISYDHRLVDGAAAARFLNDVIAYLESPSRLFLAI